MAGEVRDKTRFCNPHFYMPPEVNALDLMSDGETDRGLLDTLLAVLPEFGVYPFEARKECSGFIFNRVWAAIKRESLAVVAEGVARPEDVDGMYKLNLGAPAGPFQLMDLVGLDVALDIENHYVEEFPQLPKGARDLLQTYVTRASSVLRPARASTAIEAFTVIEIVKCELGCVGAAHAVRARSGRGGSRADIHTRQPDGVRRQRDSRAERQLADILGAGHDVAADKFGL